MTTKEKSGFSTRLNCYRFYNLGPESDYPRHPHYLPISFPVQFGPFDDSACRAYNRMSANQVLRPRGEGPLQWGPCEPGQGGDTAAISSRFFVWGPLTGGRCFCSLSRERQYE